MDKKVPLTVYKNGKKIVIGDATVSDDGTVTANITDEEMAAELGVSDISSLSIGHDDDVIDTPLAKPFKRRNVFEKDQ